VVTLATYSFCFFKGFQNQKSVVHRPTEHLVRILLRLWSYWAACVFFH